MVVQNNVLLSNLPCMEHNKSKRIVFFPNDDSS